MKRETIKRCPGCDGSGIVHYRSEFNLEDSRWCLNCETGRAKAGKVAEIIKCTQLGDKVKAA